MNTAFESLQPDCFDKLASETAFAQIALFKIRHEDWQSQINDALSAAASDPSQVGTLPGLTIEVMMPALAVTSKGALPIFKATLKFIVKENHQICFGTGGLNISAESIAQQIIQTFHGWAAGAAAVSWYCEDDAAVFREDFHPLVAYEVNAHTSFTAGQLLATPSAPVAIAAGSPDTATITCPLNTAVIYYTTDGTFPGPGNTGAKRDGSAGTAQIYAAPFPVNSGAVVRAAAYQTGLIGSAVTQSLAP